jgi:hypothetical protein
MGEMPAVPTDASAKDNWSRLLELVLTLYASAVFLVLWGGFLLALIVNTEWLDSIWLWLRDLPVALEIGAWAAFLPAAVGLWIWHSSWPSLAQWAGCAGVVAWTLLAWSGIWRLSRSQR